MAFLSLDVPSTFYLSRYGRNYRSCPLDSSQRNLAGSKAPAILKIHKGITTEGFALLFLRSLSLSYPSLY